MIELIIKALSKYCRSIKEGKLVCAEILIWLREQMSNSKDQELINEYLDKNNRCKNCGQLLTITYRKDMRQIPPKRIELKTCLNCRKD